MTGRLTIPGNEKGFTLIELLTVLAIVATLASMAMPQFQRYVIRSKEASLSRTLFVIRDVIDQYYADSGHYPDSLDDLVDKQYIRSVPTDPFTRSQDTWVLIFPDTDDTGIYDIHSGSDRVSLEGVPYNEW